MGQQCLTSQGVILVYNWSIQGGPVFLRKPQWNEFGHDQEAMGAILEGEHREIWGTR